MHINYKLLILLAIFISSRAFAGPAQNIELTDGSIVRAEVVSLSGGTYTLRSDTLGEMRIPAAKIKSITIPEVATATANSAAPSTADLDSIRNSLINNPTSMAKIESLQSDPLVQDILNDEATMRAINSGDVATLMNDPKIKALMEHSTVRDLSQSGL